MAVCAGAAIRDLCRTYGLPLPKALLSSPLLRCVQTCAGAAQGMGVGASVCVEPALCETICEDWYRSWGVPGADGAWGGPAGSDVVRGNPTPPPGLHPAALGKVSDLFHIRWPQLLYRGEGRGGGCNITSFLFIWLC